MYEKLKRKVLPDLIPPNSRILIAVSGGPDSVALAHMLWCYANEERERDISLVISHINHGVRKESEQEEELVQNLAELWDIPCLIHRFDAKQYAKDSGKSFQEGAREWRYLEWNKDMKEFSCTLLATAHHLGDQAETILYRLIRGSGTAGLAGIYPSYKGIIRPLLDIKKEQILEYCQKHNLPYAHDKSNEETLYDRNRIRLNLIPLLEQEYNPRIIEVLGKTAEILRWDEEYILSQVEKIWGESVIKEAEDKVILKRSIFQQPYALLSRLLRRAISLVNNEPRGIGFEYIQRIIQERGKSRWAQDFPGVQVVIEAHEVLFRKPILNHAETEIDPGDIAETTLLLNEWVVIPELKITIGLFDEDTPLEDLIQVSKQGNRTETIGLSRSYWDEVKLPLVCRTRKEGDKMLFRGIGHKSLKKVFQEEEVPPIKRKTIPLIGVGSEVLWIPGIRRSDLGIPVEAKPQVILKAVFSTD